MTFRSAHVPVFLNRSSSLAVLVNADGAGALLKIVSANGEQGVAWVHSYVSADKTRTFCIYDAPRRSGCL